MRESNESVNQKSSKKVGVLFLVLSIVVTSQDLIVFAEDEGEANIAAVIEAVNKVNSVENGKVVSLKIDNTNIKIKRTVNKNGDSVVSFKADSGESIVCSYDFDKEELKCMEGSSKIYTDQMKSLSNTSLQYEEDVRAAGKKTVDTFFKAYSYRCNTIPSYKGKYYSLSNGSKVKYPVKYAGKNKTQINKFKKGVSRISSNGKKLKNMFKGKQLLQNVAAVINAYARCTQTGSLTKAAALAALMSVLLAMGVCVEYINYACNIFYGEISCEVSLRKAKMGL